MRHTTHRILRRAAVLLPALVLGLFTASPVRGAGDQADPPAWPMFRPDWQPGGARQSPVRRLSIQLGMGDVRRMDNPFAGPDRAAARAVEAALEKSRVRMRTHLVRIVDEPMRSALVAFDATPPVFGDGLRLARLTEVEKVKVRKLVDAARDRLKPRRGVVVGNSPLLFELNVKVRAVLPPERQRWLNEMLYALGRSHRSAGGIDVPDEVVVPPQTETLSGRLLSLDLAARRARFTGPGNPSLRWKADTVFAIDGRPAGYADLVRGEPVLRIAEAPGRGPRLMVQCPGRPMTAQTVRLAAVNGRRLSVDTPLADTWILADAVTIVDDDGPRRHADLRPGMTITAVVAGTPDNRRVTALWIRAPGAPATSIRRGVVAGQPRRYAAGHRNAGVVLLASSGAEATRYVVDDDTVFMRFNRQANSQYRVTAQEAAAMLEDGPLSGLAGVERRDDGDPRLAWLRYDAPDPDAPPAPTVTDLPPLPEPPDDPPGYAIALPEDRPRFRMYDPWLMAGISTIQPRGPLALTYDRTQAVRKAVREVRADLLAEVRPHLADAAARSIDRYLAHVDEFGPHLALLAMDDATRNRVRAVLARWRPVLLTPGLPNDLRDRATMGFAHAVFAALPEAKRKELKDIQARVFGHPLPRPRPAVFRPGLNLLYVRSIDREAGTLRGTARGGIHLTGFRKDDLVLRDGQPAEAEALARDDRIVTLRFAAPPRHGGNFLWTERPPAIVAGRIARLTGEALELDGAPAGRIALTEGTVVIDAEGRRRREALAEGAYAVAALGGAPGKAEAWCLFLRPGETPVWTVAETALASAPRKVRDDRYSLSLKVRPDRTADFRLADDVTLAWRRAPEDGRELTWATLEARLKEGELPCYAMLSRPKNAPDADAPLEIARIAVMPKEYEK
jgi:hypothetical protein